MNYGINTIYCEPPKLLLFSLLDALHTSLDDKEVLTSLLNTFKTDLLAEIQTALARPNSAPSYSAAAAGPARTSAAPTPTTPAPPAPPTAKTNEFVIALNAKSELLALPVAAIWERVVAALAASGVPRLQEVELKGVKTASYWMPKLSKDSQLGVPNYRVVVDSVPKSFKPDSPHAAQELYAHNRTAISDPSVIKEVRWLNPKALRDPKKQESSLLLTVTDIVTADRCIAQTLAVESAICSAQTSTHTIQLTVTSPLRTPSPPQPSAPLPFQHD
ncbi:hypothetical protein K438DRAFT_1992963 [Mycena galopus ATCC 62051]|nr:hypothetical protein K438DRAFT_1992963 [Mycena galopus ATCC 62051]